MTHINADELIPHQGPMCLIDEIMAHRDRELWSCVKVQENLFTTAKGVHSCVGIEYLAQTAAAFFTLKMDPGSEPKQGMLIACRSYKSRVEFFLNTSPLMLYIQLSSSLPTSSASSNLVKFQGEIHALNTTLPDFSPEQWRTDYPADGAWVSADLSVYI